MAMLDFLDYWADLDWREFRKHAGLYLVLALLLVVVGPFDTGDQPFLFRLTYWFSALCIFGGLVMPLMARLLRSAGWFQHAPLIPGAVGVLCIAAIPMTVIVASLDVIVVSILRTDAVISLFSIQHWQNQIGGEEPLDMASALLLYVQVLVIILIIIGLISLVAMPRLGEAETAQSLSVRPGTAFFSRLPDHIGTDLLYLQMEDHYLRVVTRDGEALILVRLRDAMNELEAFGGLQVHRSWWVVSAEIEKLSKAGRRSELVMSNGGRVPVSSSYKESVEQLLAVQLNNSGR